MNKTYRYRDIKRHTGMKSRASSQGPRLSEFLECRRLTLRERWALARGESSGLSTFSFMRWFRNGWEWQDVDDQLGPCAGGTSDLPWLKQKAQSMGVSLHIVTLGPLQAMKSNESL